jgi:hypothetical protein
VYGRKNKIRRSKLENLTISDALKGKYFRENQNHLEILT